VRSSTTPDAPQPARSPRRTTWRNRYLLVAASVVIATTAASAPAINAAWASPAKAAAPAVAAPAKPRTVITTDGEQDDKDSMIRYLAYADEFDTVGLVYSSSVWHWAGDGQGTTFNGKCGVSTSCRWLGTSWIQDMLDSYGQEYKNFKTHDANYPTEASLQNVVRVGNIDFPGEMSQDTDGSNLIKSLLLDNKPGPLYLQAWGGMNTIARALQSIQQQYQNTPQWAAIYNKVSTKAVIMASGFQDTPSNLFTSYIGPNWPRIQVNELDGGYTVWAYTKISAQPVENQYYYSAAFMKPNIIDQGPLGAWEYTYGDGRGGEDPGYNQWDSTAQPEYTFVSEGDNVAFLGLINTGLQSDNPTYGGWGGRQLQTSISPNEFTNVASDTYANGQPLAKYDWSRWFPAQQLDFAARLKWGVTPKYAKANHAPVTQVLSGNTVSVAAGKSVQLQGLGYDPDGNALTVQWWQYRDAGNYAGLVDIAKPTAFNTKVTVPADAHSGQTIHLIMQVTDNGTPALTSYQRVVITVK
jgi:hypothetical protein